MTDAEIVRIPDVLAIIRLWKSEGWEGCNHTPAVLADKLQDYGYAAEWHLTQLRAKAVLDVNYCDLDDFKEALDGVPAALATYDWREAFVYADKPDPCPPDSGVKLDPITRETVTEIIVISEGENDGDSWLIVGKLTDGRYFFLTAWCDYTGWDCRSGGNADVGLTLEDVIVHGLGDDDRKRLGFNLNLQKTIND